MLKYKKVGLLFVTEEDQEKKQSFFSTYDDDLFFEQISLM